MPNFTGEIGVRYKAYETETNDPNEYRFINAEARVAISKN